MFTGNSARTFRTRWSIGMAAALLAGGAGFGLSLVPAAAAESAPQSAPQSATSDGDSAAWLDSRRPIPDRVRRLLSRMTLAEKVGQMDQQLVTGVTSKTDNVCGGGGFSIPLPDCMEEVLVNQNTGSILAGGTENPIDTTGKGGVGNTGYDWANQYNIIQSYAIENTRLHIPVIFGVDAVHGFGHPWQAPLFPHSIGIGATWDPAMATASGAVTARATAATGWNWVFAPVQDLHRDNRWGRTYETWAEQPVLASALGAANVKGLQIPAARGSLGVAATVKHFAGYSQSINGHDRNEALLPLSYLQSVDPARLHGRHRRRRDDRHGRFRVDQRGPGARLALPADRHPARPTGFRRRRDQRLPGRAGAADHLSRGRGPARAPSPRPSTPGVDMSMQVFDADQWQAAAIAAVGAAPSPQARIDEAVPAS